MSFPIDVRPPSKSAPVVGTHAANVDGEYYGKFLKELDKVDAHVYKSWCGPLAMGLPGGKKLRFAENLNIDSTDRIKFNEKPEATSKKKPRWLCSMISRLVFLTLETSCMSLDQPFLLDIHQVLKTVRATALGKTRTRGQGVSTWGCGTPFAPSEVV